MIARAAIVVAVPRALREVHPRGVGRGAKSTRERDGLRGAIAGL